MNADCAIFYEKAEFKCRRKHFKGLLYSASASVHTFVPPSHAITPSKLTGWCKFFPKNLVINQLFKKKTQFLE